MRQKELLYILKNKVITTSFTIRTLKALLAIFKMINTTEDIITLHLIGGKLMKPKLKKQAKLEFRLLKEHV